MSIYRRMVMCSWEQGVFPRLSPLPPSEQSLSLMLMLSPLSTIIPGVSNGGRGACLDLLRAWSGDDLDRCVAGLERHGAIVDLQARVIFQPWALDDAAPESPNVVRAWKKRWDELPACDVKQAIDEYVRRFLIAYCTSDIRPTKTKDGKPVDPWAWIRAWDSTFTEASLKAGANLPATFPKGSDEPSPTTPESPAAPFTESGSRKQEAGIRGQEAGSNNSEQGSGSRWQGKGRGKPPSAQNGNGQPSKPEVTGAPFMCRCESLIYKSTDGRRWNDVRGQPDFTDEHRCVRSATVQ